MENLKEFGEKAGENFDIFIGESVDYLNVSYK